MAASPEFTIGVLGDPPHTTLDPELDTEPSVVTGDGETVYAQDPDVVVAVGGAGVRTALDLDRSTPLFPVDVGAPLDRAGSTVADAVETLQTASWTTTTHRILEVQTSDSTVSSLLDVTVMTTEPGHISEYEISPGANNDGRRVRADGVVVTTPLGSSGYAAAAGGPTLSPATDAVGVVPVSPFAVARRSWVEAPPVSVTVRRDESAVALFSDGATVAGLSAGESVDVSWGGTAVIATVASPDEKT